MATIERWRGTFGMMLMAGGLFAGACGGSDADDGSLSPAGKKLAELSLAEQEALCAHHQRENVERVTPEVVDGSCRAHGRLEQYNAGVAGSVQTCETAYAACRDRTQDEIENTQGTLGNPEGSGCGFRFEGCELTVADLDACLSDIRQEWWEFWMNAPACGEDPTFEYGLAPNGSPSASCEKLFGQCERVISGT